MTTIVSAHKTEDSDACQSQFTDTSAPMTTYPTRETRLARTVPPSSEPSPSPSESVLSEAPTAEGVSGQACVRRFGTLIDSVRHADFTAERALDGAPDGASRKALEAALKQLFVDVNTMSTAEAVEVATEAMRPYCAVHPGARATTPRA